MNARTVLHVATIFLLGLTALPAAAQPPGKLPDRYADVPLPDDLKLALKDRLKQTTGLASLEAFQSTLKQLVDLSRPNLNSLAPDAVKNFDSFDAIARAFFDSRLETMLDPEQAKMRDDLLKKFSRKDIANIIKNDFGNPAARDKLLRDILPNASRPTLSEMPPPSAPIEPPSDDLKDWLTKMMNRAEQSRWGEVLENSSGWQKLLQDMKAPGSSGPGGNPLEGWTGWTSQLKWRPEFDLNLKNLRLPDLGRFNLRSRWPGMPSLRFSLPQPSMPNFSPPSMSLSSPSSGQFQLLGWGVLFVMALFLLRSVFRSSSRRASAKTNAALGPWPVAPGAVSTRRQLVQAFDYLAILLLGADAQSWNHRRAAESLGGKDESTRQAAQRLAEIYETARYTEGPNALPEPQRAAVRGDLCLLARLPTHSSTTSSNLAIATMS